GTVFDINPSAVRAFAREGIAAQHLQLGWTAQWDHISGRERDIDILFLGSISERRERALGSYARTMSRYRVELVLSDNSRPNWGQSGSFRSDEDKWDLLTRAKILLNIHQGEEPYFEWLRVAQAISSGAVVVSEHSIDFAPLVPGEDLLLGDITSLDLLAEMLLEDGDHRWRMQTAAYHKLRNQLTMAPAVRKLAATAAELAQRELVPDGEHRFFTQPQPDPARLPIVSAPIQPPSQSNGDPNSAWMRRALKDLRLELLGLRRDMRRIELEAARTTPLPQLEIVAQTDAFAAAAPRVSVLTALYNHAALVRTALSSAARVHDCVHELIVVDDGSSDGSCAAVTEWMRHHQDTPGILLRHQWNRGLAATRNDALNLARGEYSLALDADNELYPHSLSRLTDTLDGNPDAAFAYGTLEKFRGDECLGLMNTLSWEPWRLRGGNYIDAMAMMRNSIIRDELGGYPSDPRLHGWEDYALWCAAASAGHRGIRVAEIVARYRVARHSMLSLTNISVTDVFSVIIEANPTLMAGVEAPD
ncbi:MAG: glycosyltransferase family 2 protein, partial [Steroidobacteraceae bacterium]